jgi:hypothetical protein
MPKYYFRKIINTFEITIIWITPVGGVFFRITSFSPNPYNFDCCESRFSFGIFKRDKIKEGGLIPVWFDLELASYNLWVINTDRLYLLNWILSGNSIRNKLSA